MPTASLSDLSRQCDRLGRLTRKAFARSRRTRRSEDTSRARRLANAWIDAMNAFDAKWEEQGPAGWGDWTEIDTSTD